MDDSQLATLKALANGKRLLILKYLRDPELHFPAQIDGDLVRDGVCADFIREKLRLSPAAITQHLKVLSAAGLVRRTRIKQWAFFKRCERRIKSFTRSLSREL